MSKLAVVDFLKNNLNDKNKSEFDVQGNSYILLSILIGTNQNRDYVSALNNELPDDALFEIFDKKNKKKEILDLDQIHNLIYPQSIAASSSLASSASSSKPPTRQQKRGEKRKRAPVAVSAAISSFSNRKVIQKPRKNILNMNFDEIFKMYISETYDDVQTLDEILHIMKTIYEKLRSKVYMNSEYPYWIYVYNVVLNIEMGSNIAYYTDTREISARQYKIMKMICGNGYEKNSIPYISCVSYDNKFIVDVSKILATHIVPRFIKFMNVHIYKVLNDHFKHLKDEKFKQNVQIRNINSDKAIKVLIDKIYIILLNAINYFKSEDVSIDLHAYRENILKPYLHEKVNIELLNESGYTQTYALTLGSIYSQYVNKPFAVGTYAYNNSKPLHVMIMSNIYTMLSNPEILPENIQKNMQDIREQKIQYLVKNIDTYFNNPNFKFTSSPDIDFFNFYHANGKNKYDLLKYIYKFILNTTDDSRHPFLKLRKKFSYFALAIKEYSIELYESKKIPYVHDDFDTDTVAGVGVTSNEYVFGELFDDENNLETKILENAEHPQKKQTQQTQQTQQTSSSQKKQKPFPFHLLSQKSGSSSSSSAASSQQSLTMTQMQNNVPATTAQPTATFMGDDGNNTETGTSRSGYNSGNLMTLFHNFLGRR